MANYTKATNFTAKDTLPTGNAGKIVKGTEIDTEFTAIASAISSKADSNSPTFTGTPTAPTASAGTNTTQLATTAFVQAAGGRIIQTVSSTSTTVFSTTSTSFVSTGHTATITPTSTSSKILCLVTSELAQASTNLNTHMTLFRDSTNLAGSGNAFCDVLSSAGNIYANAAINYLDSPSSISALTYSTRILVDGGTGVYNAGGTGVTAGRASIVLLEIL